MQGELDILEDRYLGTAGELQQLRSAQSSKEQRLRSRLAQVGPCLAEVTLDCCIGHTILVVCAFCTACYRTPCCMKRSCGVTRAAMVRPTAPCKTIAHLPSTDCIDLRTCCAAGQGADEAAPQAAARRQRGGRCAARQRPAGGTAAQHVANTAEAQAAGCITWQRGALA